MSRFASRGENSTAFTARISAVAPLSEEEKRALHELTNRPPVVFPRGRDLLTAGEPVRQGYVMDQGWAMWHEDLPDGTLQVFDFILPGDIVGFTALALERQRRMRQSAAAGVGSTISVTALTPVAAVPVALERVDRLFRTAPELGALLLALTAVNRSAGMRRHLTNVGRRSARARLADLFLELWTRQREVGLADECGFALPVNQATLGAMLGLTPVHVSRVVTQLRREGILSVRMIPERRVVFHDLDAVRSLAGATKEREG